METQIIDFLNDWARLIATLFGVLAILAGAAKYIFLVGAPRRHTELTVRPQKLGDFDDEKLFEIHLRIDNKGVRLLELYNIYLHLRAIEGSPVDWRWSSDNLITENDEKLWLHAGTGYSMHILARIPATVSVVGLEFVVPYCQSRLVGDPLTGQETAEITDYNSIERFFVTGDTQQA